jgi:hypothetical protein
MFIAAQFTIAKLSNQSRCPSADGVWKCVIYTYIIYNYNNSLSLSLVLLSHKE